MPHSRKIMILLSCSLLLIASFPLVRGDREPFYRGKSLSEWVMSCDEDSDAEAACAIRLLGTRAIPHLLKWIQYEPSNARQESLYRINKATGWVQDRLKAPGDWSIYDRGRLLAPAVPKAFAILAAQASSAVPDLTRLLNDPIHPWTAARAAKSLACLGEAGLPSLMAALTSTNVDLRQITLGNLKQLGTNVQPAIPLLIQILENDVGENSRAAANVLGDSVTQPDIVVPALVRALANTNYYTRFSSAAALGHYGPLARPAVPALSEWVTGTDSTLRCVARDALRAIDPKTMSDEPTAAR